MKNILSMIFASVFGISIAGGFISFLNFAPQWFPKDKGDQVQFYTDPGTACEYLISPNGTLVPRIGHDYMQGGCDPQEDY